MHFYQKGQKQKKGYLVCTYNIHIYQFYLNINDNYHWTQSAAESDTFCKDVTDAISNKVFKATNMNFMTGWKKVKANIFGCGYISVWTEWRCHRLFQGWHSKKTKKHKKSKICWMYSAILLCFSKQSCVLSDLFDDFAPFDYDCLYMGIGVAHKYILNLLRCQYQ